MDDIIETVNCRYGWEYNLTGYFKSVTSDVREYIFLLLYRLGSTRFLYLGLVLFLCARFIYIVDYNLFDLND